MILMYFQFRTAIDSRVNAFPDIESRKRWRENLNL